MVGFPGETRETMRKTLDLAFSIRPDSAQFYPVMPYPGTGAFEYYRQKGYLISDNFRQWLNGAGGHRCVLNLPGLPAREIEEFCEQAFRAFHLRPRYLLYKLLQAVRNPREGLRSFVAGIHYVRYLIKRKPPEHEPPVLPLLPVDEQWDGYIRVPMGRMEKIMKTR